MDLCQACSNYVPGVKNGPATGGSHVLRSLISGKTWKNRLVWNHQALSLDIWYVACPSKPLPSLFKLCPWGQIRPYPRWHQGHGQLSTYTNILALTQVGDLGPVGPLVFRLNFVYTYNGKERQVIYYCRANQEWQWRNILFTIAK